MVTGDTEKFKRHRVHKVPLTINEIDEVRGHAFFPQELKKRFKEVGSQEDVPENKKMVIAKYFYASWTWYALEYDPETERFFGWVDGPSPEYGHFSLLELGTMRINGFAIERDLYCGEKKLSEVITKCQAI